MTVRVFYPHPHFVPVSLSGVSCQLQCQHCRGHFLKGMTAITKPHELHQLSEKIEQSGGTGILISSGSDNLGRSLNLECMLDTIHRIKSRGNLIVAIHPGRVSEQRATDISTSCHVAFADIIGDDSTARQVIGTGSVNEYAANIHRLTEGGIPVTPHLTVGLHYGKIRGEHKALETLESMPIHKIVINVICPTAGTAFADIAIPNSNTVKDIITQCIERGWHPVLGCMRPRGHPEFEQAAFDAGVTDFALPSKTLRARLHEEGERIQPVHTCCGVPDSILNTLQRGSQ